MWRQVMLESAMKITMLDGVGSSYCNEEITQICIMLNIIKINYKSCSITCKWTCLQIWIYRSRIMIDGHFDPRPVRVYACNIRIYRWIIASLCNMNIILECACEACVFWCRAFADMQISRRRMVWLAFNIRLVNVRPRAVYSISDAWSAW